MIYFEKTALLSKIKVIDAWIKRFAKQRVYILTLLWLFMSLAGICQTDIPVRGLMITPKNTDMDNIENLKFIRTLANEGVNTIILGLTGYNFPYSSYPQITSSKSPTLDWFKAFKDSCAVNKIEVVPEVSTLSHQSYYTVGNPVWYGSLLENYPWWDAELLAPYSSRSVRSWNPLIDSVQTVTRALNNDIVSFFNSKVLHIGMDEPMSMPNTGERGFTGQTWGTMWKDQFMVRYNELNPRGIKTWLWGDRLLDNDVWQIGPWEADAHTGRQEINTVIDLLPRLNVLICDWHYNSSPNTGEYFADKGFDVLLTAWDNSWVGLEHINHIMNATPARKSKFRGYIQGNWSSIDKFRKGYFYGADSTNVNFANVVNTFKTVMAKIRVIDPDTVQTTSNKLKIFLEDQVALTTIPSVQPYNIIPWNYNGTETVLLPNSNIIDWVLVELRSDLTTTAFRKAGILLKDGTVLNGDLSPFTAINGNYYIVVKHRNHLGIISDKKISISNLIPNFDFTISNITGLKKIGNYCYLVNGDTDNNNLVNILDYKLIVNSLFYRGYSIADLNFDGVVNVLDYSPIYKNLLTSGVN